MKIDSSRHVCEKNVVLRVRRVCCKRGFERKAELEVDKIANSFRPRQIENSCCWHVGKFVMVGERGTSQSHDGIGGHQHGFPSFIIIPRPTHRANRLSASGSRQGKTSSNVSKQ